MYLLLISEWCKARNMSADFEQLTPPELSALLRRFYGEVRKQDGTEYSKNALAGIRSAIHRHLTSAPFHVKYNIMYDSEFKSANNILVGVLKKMKREGKDDTKSYKPISSGDLQKLIRSGVLGTDNPLQLQDLVWFSIQFYLCRRGCEGVKEFTKSSFLFHTDDRGIPYITLAYNEASKNHPGGFKDTNDPKKRMYATGGPLCPVNALKMYMGKLHPNCEAFYQRPDEYHHVNGIWYQPIPLGIRRLQTMMSRLSSAAALSTRYTNHCLRATAITNLVNSGFDPITISRLSGHRNPSSVTSYCKDVSDDTKRWMGGALTASLQQPSTSRTPLQEVPSMPREVHTASGSTPEISYRPQFPAASAWSAPHSISICPQAASTPNMPNSVPLQEESTNTREVPTATPAQIQTTAAPLPSTVSTATTDMTDPNSNNTNNMISFSNRQALSSSLFGNCTIHIGSLHVYNQK